MAIYTIDTFRGVNVGYTCLPKCVVTFVAFEGQIVESVARLHGTVLAVAHQIHSIRICHRS